MGKAEFDGTELPTNMNMPVWILTPKEEAVIFERWRKKAFARCDDLIKKYIACTNSVENPMEAMKRCEGINKEQLECVAKYQKMEYLDQERDILIAEKKVKQKAYREKLIKALEERKEKGA